MNARVEPKAIQIKPDVKTVEGTRFYGSGRVEKEQFLFQVSGGVDLTDALNSISDMLDMIEEPILDAAMGEKELQHNDAWRVHFILKAAKAAVDSLWIASEKVDRVAKELASLNNQGSTASPSVKE
ncbi:DUF3077 domain-containing protein [Pseudomonas sp. ABC1]|uniref:DUF3077 domain-containing protein n=1 Tax=Pseudomonas sp. ABC1 TaxID=2748080 RepID=UPI0015C3850C|nr:DUF3077 domain-containing protein [Pseudomonas sp. ABC1]QLF92289.1 DUF3077 domain-containing protein [Pseudomonas sp. ABC1]